MDNTPVALELGFKNTSFNLEPSLPLGAIYGRGVAVLLFLSPKSIQLSLRLLDWPY